MLSCQTCETNDDGNLRFKALIMDGTATRVLGKLPNFVRPKLHVEKETSTGKAQYIVGHRPARSFVNKFFKEALKSHAKGCFTIDLPCSSTAEHVSGMFFEQRTDSQRRGQETRLPLLFEVAFSAPRLREMLLNGPLSTKVIVTHSLKNIRVRSALCDFSVGFLTESIPTIVITTPSHEEAALKVLRAL